VHVVFRPLFVTPWAGPSVTSKWGGFDALRFDEAFVTGVLLVLPSVSSLYPCTRSRTRVSMFATPSAGCVGEIGMRSGDKITRV
jgi:hypothetical protein